MTSLPLPNAFWPILSDPHGKPGAKAGPIRRLRGWPGAIVLSLLIHGAAAAAGLIFTWHAEPSLLPAVSVEIVARAGPATAKPKRSTPAARPQVVAARAATPKKPAARTKPTPKSKLPVARKQTHELARLARRKLATAPRRTRASAPVRPAAPAQTASLAADFAPPSVPLGGARGGGNAIPEYPARARRRGWEGRVLLVVRVRADGAAETVRVASSSGHGILDRAARDAVRRWRFNPARRAGISVAASLEVPVTFRLIDRR